MCVPSLLLPRMTKVQSIRETGEPWSCQSHISTGECPMHWDGQRCAPSCLCFPPHTPHPASHTLPTPKEQNSCHCHWPWEDSGTAQRCRRMDFSSEILAICRTIGSFLWAWPRWIIISRPHMLIGAGAQPALYPLAGHHHIPAQDWKSKATKPKQKLNCALRREKKQTLLPAGNLRKPYGTSTVNKN